MQESYFIGLDIAKNVLQAFAADSKAREVSNKMIAHRKGALVPTKILRVGGGMKENAVRMLYARSGGKVVEKSSKNKRTCGYRRKSL